jgi:hypothetical protein
VAVEVFGGAKPAKNGVIGVALAVVIIGVSLAFPEVVPLVKTGVCLYVSLKAARLAVVGFESVYVVVGNKPARQIQKVISGFIEFVYVAASGYDVVHNAGLLDVG